MKKQKLFQKIQEKRNIQKDQVLNLSVLAVFDDPSQVHIVPDTDFTNIKTLFSIKKNNQTFTFDLEGNYTPVDKIYYFSFFIGFMKFEEMFLVFAEQVTPKIFGKCFVFSIQSVIVLSLKKFKRNKNLSTVLSLYFSGQFFFSFENDLTFSQNYPKFFLNTEEKMKRLNWFFFINRNMIIHCLKRSEPNFEEWVVPLIYGNFYQTTFDTKNKKFTLAFVWKESIQNLYQQLEKDFDIQIEIFSPTNLSVLDMIIFDSNQIKTFSIYFCKHSEIFLEYPEQNQTDDLQYKYKQKDFLNFFSVLESFFEIQHYYIELNKANEKHMQKIVLNNIKYFEQKFGSFILLNSFSISSLSNTLKQMIEMNKKIGLSDDKIIAAFVINKENLDSFQNFQSMSKQWIQLITKINDEKEIQKLNNICQYAFTNIKKSSEQTITKFKEEIKNKIYKEEIQNISISKFYNSIYGSENSFSKSLKKLHNKYNYPLFKFEKIKIAIVIHNCGGLNPNDKIPKSESNEKINLHYLQREDIKSADLIILGLQEIVEMKGKNLTNIVTNYNEEQVKAWTNYFKIQFQEYLLIGQASILGIITIILLKKSQKKNFHVQVMEHKIVKLGFMYLAANKGGLYLQLKINSDEIALFNCHLQAGEGEENNKYRIEGLLWFEELLKDKDNLSGVFMFGDMNFRNTAKCQEIMDLIEKFTKSENDEEKQNLIKTLKNTENLTQFMKNRKESLLKRTID